MSDTVQIETHAGREPVIIVRLRYTYENTAENLLAAIREIQKEIVRLEYRRNV